MSHSLTAVERIDIEANGLRFTAVATGPNDGPLALCLHGFPDCALTWRLLLPDLAAAGFRAVAPWTRGYAPTEIPADASYGVGALAADACALHEALGGDERAVLIGHDWGALTGYAAASFAPERWRSLVTAAVPPPAAIGAGLLSYDQLKRSFYVFVFQTPLAELAVAADDLAFVERLWRDWSPGYDASTDLPAVKDALRAAPNLAAAIGYYRAMMGAAPPDPAHAAQQAAAGSTPPQPTLYLHGDSDGCMAVELASGAERFLSPGSRAEVVGGAGHFLHLE
ncbi:MAG: alpha/beta fold hydrolase, partial [Chloroflexi bacterium]|nr:alpha/beta fold hydrolase [Chloroflexota bacterium]